jgi:hypothetical protein
MHPTNSTVATVFAILVSALAAGCKPSVDLLAGLRVEGVASGWRTAGVHDGLNKLVPTVSFTLRNVSGETLPLLQVNAVFRRAGENGEWGARFAPAADSKGLEPGESTQVLVLSSDLGYTGSDGWEDMLRNAKFVDVDVDVFAKYGSAQWVRLGRFPVQRQLMALASRQP